MMRRPISGEVLADTGSVYVTDAAVRQFAAFTHDNPGTARRKLTVMLLNARMVAPATETKLERWRARSSTVGLDVDALVSHEDGLAVVVQVFVRPYMSPRTRRLRETQEHPAYGTLRGLPEEDSESDDDMD